MPECLSKKGGEFWFKHQYIDTLYSTKDFQEITPRYVFDLGDNNMDYIYSVHARYMDIDIDEAVMKSSVGNLLLGNNIILYKLWHRGSGGWGIYSPSEGNLYYTDNIFRNDIDEHFKELDLNKQVIDRYYCDGEYLYLLIQSHVFFEEGNTPPIASLAEDSNPVVVKLKLK